MTAANWASKQVATSTGYDMSTFHGPDAFQRILGPSKKKESASLVKAETFAACLACGFARGPRLHRLVQRAQLSCHASSWQSVATSQANRREAMPFACSSHLKPAMRTKKTNEALCWRNMAGTSPNVDLVEKGNRFGLAPSFGGKLAENGKVKARDPLNKAACLPSCQVTPRSPQSQDVTPRWP